MIRMLALMILTFIWVSESPAQQLFTFSQPVLSEVKGIESHYKGSKFRYNFPVSLPSGYFPGYELFKLAQPIPYSRETSPLKTTIEYYFSVPDSTVRLIEYSWNCRDDKIIALEKNFEQNLKIVSNYFHHKGDLSSETHTDWSQKTIVWQNERLYVKQFMVTGNGTNKLRMLISWKNQ